MALRLQFRLRVSNVILRTVLLVALSANCESRTTANLKVQLSHGGSIVGRHGTSHYGRHIRVFLGIPYARPPIGELRFEPPVPFGAWSGERLAVEDSPICIQRDPFRRDMVIEGSEDCLYLNVYTPEESRDDGPFPVMVWFHGGGWECGSGISRFYGPDFLLDHDVILVSANFRLGPLGFLSTETTDCPGNFGLKDQVEVLKWVQNNIAAFDGDPKSVTIFGESAGGASVTYHMLSAQSKGLFHRGIAQSGTYFNPWAQPAHKGVAAKRARKVAQLVGCNGHDNWGNALKCLRSKSAEDVVATIYDLFEWDFDPMIPFPPVIEPEHNDAFLTVQPRSEPHPHGFSMPLMIGSTSEEGLLRTAAWLNLPGLLNDFKNKFHNVLPIILNYDHHAPEVRKHITRRIEEFYFKNGHNYHKHDHQNLTDLISDGWFLGGIDEYLRFRMDADNVGPTFVYLFEHKGAASFSELFKGGDEDHYGACHAEDLQYLFPVGYALFPTAAPTKADLELREAILAMWVNFSKTGDPTPDGTDIPTWKPSKLYPVTYVRLGSNHDQNWTVLSTDKALYQDRADFWKQLKAHLPARHHHSVEL